MKKLWSVAFCVPFLIFALNTQAGGIDKQATLSLPLSPKDHSVRLEKVESLNSFGQIIIQKPDRFFSLSLHSENLNLPSKTDRLGFSSIRHLKQMEPGKSYLATYSIYRGQEKVDEVRDLVEVAHKPKAGFIKKTDKGFQRLYDFSIDRQTISVGQKHRFLAALPPEAESAKISVTAPHLLDINIKSAEGTSLATNSGNPEKNNTLPDFNVTDLPERVLEIVLELPHDHTTTSSPYKFHLQITSKIFTTIEEIEDGEFVFLKETDGLACSKASKSQRAEVNSGNKKKEQFLEKCQQQTNHSQWCDEVIRPNPDSRSTFTCTYGSDQPHQLIHPSTSTWKYAITAIKIIQELKDKDIDVCRINNWWRPEPYNKNVDGSPTRHPYGTSIDVAFCSKEDQNKAFTELCKIRRSGRVRAIGYYPSNVLHFGVGDRRGNTWGRSCD